MNLFAKLRRRESAPPPVIQPLSHSSSSSHLPVLLPPPPSAPLPPDFDFMPSDDFSAAIGEGAVFVVANPLDLALRGQNLMANVLVVEVSGPNTVRSILWFRFDSAALMARGVAVCRLFIESDDHSSADHAALDWVGVCGWVMDRKRA